MSDPVDPARTKPMAHRIDINADRKLSSIPTSIKQLVKTFQSLRSQCDLAQRQAVPIYMLGRSASLE
jgi:hypothetical protein